MGKNRIKTQDGTRIFYKDWGKGRPIVFSHGWPLTADAWDGQLLYFLQQGFRVIAHDRRGHGRSSQTWERNTMDQSADDLAALIEELDLQDAILVGHSTGGGEIARYIGRHGTERVAGAALVGAVTPLLIKTDANPEGVPREAADEIRKGIAGNRAQYFRDFAIPFYGANREGAKVSQASLDYFWLQCMMCGIKTTYDYVEQFSETDFTEDLRKFDVPTLIVHGEDDLIVPVDATARKAAKLIRDAELKVYPGAPHALTETHRDQFNSDLHAFVRGVASKGRKAA